MYRRCLQSILILVAFALLASPPCDSLAVLAQQPVEDTASAPLQDERLLDQLRRLAGGTPAQLGFAIREAIRHQAWADLDRFLAGGRIDRLSPEDRVLVAETVGPRMLGQAAAAPKIADPTRAALGTLGEASRAAASDEARLDEALRDLGSADRDTQLSAARRLLRGGERAIAKMAVAAADPDSPAPAGRIVGLLRGLQPDAAQALEQLSLYGSAPRRPGAQRALLALEPDRVTPILAMNLYAAGATDAERELADRALTARLGRQAAAAEVESLLVARLRQANEAYSYASSEITSQSLWQITPDHDDVRRIPATAATATAHRAADLAEMLRRLGAMQPSALVAALGAHLRYRLLADPAFGSPSDMQSLRGAWGDAIDDPNVINGVLAAARTPAGPRDHLQADPLQAIAALRVVAAVGTAALLDAHGTAMSPLVAMTDHPLPQVRYEAAAAIALLSPERPYSGSEQVLERWIEMAQLEDQPTALMLVNQPELAAPINQLLSQRGYRVTIVRTVAELVQQIDQGGDLQLVVATTRPPDYAALEMIDRVRRRPLGNRLPMVLVGELPAGFEQIGQRWEAATVVATGESLSIAARSTAESSTAESSIAESSTAESSTAESSTAESSTAESSAVEEPDFSGPVLVDAAPQPWAIIRDLRAHLLAIALSSELPPLSPAERYAFRRDGIAALTQFAERPLASRVYDWRSKPEALLDAARRSGFGDAGLKLLSSLGTPDAQDLLAMLAMNETVEIELRRKAADAFARSVDQHGNQLTSRQIAMQYQRFESARDAAAREVIGRMLAAIEARAGIVVEESPGLGRVGSPPAAPGNPVEP